MKRSSVVFENIGANRQGDVVDGEKFVLHAAALLHAAGGKANIRPVILDEKAGGAAREPAKEKHVPVVAIVARPGAAAALVVAQKLLGAVRDRHCFPIRAHETAMRPSRARAGPSATRGRDTKSGCPLRRQGSAPEDCRGPDAGCGRSAVSAAACGAASLFAAQEHAQSPKAEQADHQNRVARRVVPVLDRLGTVLGAEVDQEKCADEIAEESEERAGHDQDDSPRRRRTHRIRPGTARP